MREYWKSSLFLYSVGDGKSPTINFWRATVYTFGGGASKKTLRKAIMDVVEDAKVKLIETGEDPYEEASEAWESRQVEPGASVGVGFNVIEVSHGSRSGKLLEPEERVEVFQLQIYEAADARLGLSDAGKFFTYAKKHYRRPWREALERGAKLLWRWLAS